MAVDKPGIKKGDMVQVLSGNEAGSSGKVLEVYPGQSRVTVDGVNVLKKHTRPTRLNPQGGVVDKLGPIHVSKLMVVCPSCSKPSRTGRTRGDNGVSLRFCKRCGKTID